jgi:predicted GNAT family N-acyltransferase
VFINEQKVPESLEWDDFDHDAIHLIAIDKGTNTIGCARILANGHIGRMAVLKGKRGKGVGKALLAKAISICKVNGYKQLRLSAQNHAVIFYEKFGFTICSDEYLDANIWHVDMQLII